MDQDTSQSPEEQHQPQPSRQDMVRSNGDSNDTQRHNTGPEESGFWRGWAAVEYTQAIFSGVLVVATLVNMFVSCGQWQVAQDSLRLTQLAVESANIQAKAAQEANKLTRESQRRSDDLVADTERPWLGLHATDVSGYAVNHKFVAQLHMLNSGKTPALNVAMQTNIYWIPQGDPWIPPSNQPGTDTEEIESKGVVFPNQISTQRVPLRDPLSDALFNKLQSGAVSLLFAGSITYDDRFQRHHTTTFCRIFKPALYADALFPCPTGNTAD